MSTGRDDDALSWDGDEDPTLDGGRARPATPESSPSEPLPKGFTPVGRGSRAARAAQTAADEAVEPTPLGNVALVALGMIAAALLLFAVGWLIVSLRLQAVQGNLPVPAPTLVGITLAAAAAPLVWFVTVYALTRHARTWVRFVWLLAGVVLLVPWPFLATGAFA
ncbi:DNA polymerase III subunit gamma/tau [Microbacterium sp. RD1]|uniref:DNA polymerase III subunit gamma/tau n=1 Tax=Microbacterium sp. RD1 TaxID=3457313 RepID=UPI003FA55C82